MLWDEIRPLEENEKVRDYEKIAECYRQLVLNFERRRDYDSAEDFHVGEMEMQRKKLGVEIKFAWLAYVREWMNSYALYFVLSRYGTSYLQALAALLIAVLLFAGVFLCTGFQPSKGDMDGAGSLIEYNLWPNESYRSVALNQWVSDYIQALLLCLSIITFQRERFYVVLGPWSQFWLSIATIAMTAQAALVLLAIRRRFRR